MPRVYARRASVRITATAATADATPAAVISGPASSRACARGDQRQADGGRCGHAVPSTSADPRGDDAAVEPKRRAKLGRPCAGLAGDENARRDGGRPPVEARAGPTASAPA